MKHTEAAEIYLRDQPVVDAVAKQLEEAKKVLKAYMLGKAGKPYRGITISEVSFSRLDSALAREALGPKKTAACTVDTVRVSLQLPPALRQSAARAVDQD